MVLALLAASLSTPAWALVPNGNAEDPAVTPTPPPSSSPPAIGWCHSERRIELSPSDPTIELACGNRGYYYFTRGDRCPAESPSCQISQLTYYPKLEGGGPVSPAPGDPFSDPASRPWAAVLDWNNWHGQSMGWVIRAMSDETLDVALYDLEHTCFKEAGLTGVTDAHVLATACRLLDDIQDSAVPPPVVVNMSWGRLATAEDFSPCEAEGSLSCEIWAVLRSIGLGTERGAPPVLVAAAGNYGSTPMTPGIYEHILRVGVLDLGSMRSSGSAVASWESPADAEVLFPGLAVCTGDTGHPAPAGSSTAAAVFSGVMGKLIAGADLAVGPETYAGRWFPTTVIEDGDVFYHLAHSLGGPNEVPESHLITSATFGDLMKRLTTPALPPCWPGGLSAAEGPFIDMSATPLSIPSRSLPEIFAGLNQPLPTPVVCGACPGEGDIDSGILRPSPSHDDPGPTNLAISLAGGHAPDHFTITALHLRVGDQFFAPVTRSSLGVVTEIMKSDNPVIVLRDVVLDGSSISLILSLELPGCQGSEACSFWVGAPIAVLTP